MAAKPTLTEARDALIAAEREARRWHTVLVEHAEADREAVVSMVRGTIAEAGADDAATPVLVAMARLLGELEGDAVVDALIDILASESVQARAEAGEQLQGLAYDRFKEVALGVERALRRLPTDSPALVELPFLLVEVGEGGVARLLTQFLGHDDGDVVAAAIEGIAALGDPSAMGALEKLVRDGRRTSLDDDEGVTVGELAEDAIALLGAMEEGEDR